jgi:quinol monooxygenase YgiN
MLHLVAFVTAQPGKRAALLDAFGAIVPAVRAEDGCIEYTPVVDAEGYPPATPVGPDTFIVVEKWASREAWYVHVKAPHLVAYEAQTKNLVAKLVLHIMKDV